MYRYNSLHIQLHNIFLNIRIGHPAFQKNNICDLLCFVHISHFAICSDSNLDGYPEYPNRIETNNKSDQISRIICPALVGLYILKK